MLAILKKDTEEPWYHVTHPSRLPTILRDGLDPHPKERTFAEGFYASLGGIYVTSGRFLPTVTRFMAMEFGTRALVVLRLRLLAGTPFCLDEDHLNDWHGEYEDPKEIRSGGGVDDALFREAVVATEPEYKRHVPARLLYDDVWQLAFDQTVVVPEDLRRERLDKWSCRLARAVDQDRLYYWRLRIFRAPEIIDVTQL